MRVAGRSLLKKGLSEASVLPSLRAIKDITSLSRGDLRGLLGSLAKAGLGDVVPGSSTALQELGFDAEDSTDKQHAWENYVEIAKEAYKNLAESMCIDTAEPAVANRIAYEALAKAFKSTAQQANDAKPVK